MLRRVQSSGALMSLETVYYLSQLIVAVVVVATLIAIWLQSRQTNRIAKAELTLECWRNAEVSQRDMVDTPEKTEFVHLILWEPRKPTPVEMQRKHGFLAVAFSNFEGAHYLYSRGLIEDAAYHAIRFACRNYLQTPGGRRYWNDWYSKRVGDPDFLAIVEAIAAEEPVHKDKIRP